MLLPSVFGKDECHNIKCELHSRFGSFLGGKGCLATCPHLCNRNEGFSTAMKHNVLKAIFLYATDEQHGFELAKMRNS